MEKNNLPDLETDYDSLGDGVCIKCGSRLLKSEMEEAEDLCTDCLYADTAGIFLDNPYKELDKP